jgi:hypothetical protein
LSNKEIPRDGNQRLFFDKKSGDKIRERSKPKLMGNSKHTPNEPAQAVGERPNSSLAIGENVPEKSNPAPVDPFSTEQIENRAKTLSPLLQQLLNFRPSSHWGINE